MVASSIEVHMSCLDGQEFAGDVRPDKNQEMVSGHTTNTIKTKN